MKKKYQAPVVLIETYELNQSIANNCAVIVNNGPADLTHEQCSKYEDIWGGLSLREPEFVTQQETKNIQFYEDSNCDCYTTGYGSYWTS